MQIIRSIQNRIYEIRGERVMLDFDLAALYEVETRALNQTVKRNIQRFPKDFMFRLTPEEWNPIRSQIVTTSSIPAQRSQIVIFEHDRAIYSKYPPHAFTEQGVSMLSGVLNSDKAISMHIAIMRAFVEIRRILLQETNIKEQLRQIQERITDHDIDHGSWLIVHGRAFYELSAMIHELPSLLATSRTPLAALFRILIKNSHAIFLLHSPVISNH